MSSPDNFDHWADRIRKHTAGKKGPFFYTEPVKPLFDVYLDSFTDPKLRQVHNCRCCQHFMERFGSLATIENGEVMPLFWNAAGVPDDYAHVQAALWAAVQRAPIGGVFYSSDSLWGDGPKAPKNWTHFQVMNPAGTWAGHGLQDAGQAMALKLEERGMLERALADFSIDVARKAVAILKTEQLYQSEKVLGIGEWFLRLREDLAANKNWQKHGRILWAAVAAAPIGYVHIRSSMIGTLLDDLKSGMDFADVKKRFDAKMHPLQYRRPTAAPSDGQIAQAEKIISALRSAGSLARRFAKIEDLIACWKPAPVKPAKEDNGVFAHLRRQQHEAAIDTGTPPTAITWEKFARTVLPTAERIEYRTSHGNESLLAFVTAANPTAPPIVQWENQVTWYMYHGGSPAQNWNLAPGAYVPVNAIALNPAHWDTERSMAHHGKMAVLVLEGAKDTRHTAGGGLFISHLKSEYNEIRHTLEAHFGRSPIADRDAATACGLGMQAGSGHWNHVVRVTAVGVVTLYRLERWD